MNRIAATLATPAFALAASGCATPQLDRRIAELRGQIATQRAVLAPLADPLRGEAGKDVQAEVSARPIHDVLDRFNGLSLADRTMTLNSYRTSGYIARTWTDCWFGTKLGFEVRPEAFAGIIYIDHIDHRWSQNGGLNFRLQRTFGAAGLLVGGRVQFCGPIFDIPIGFAAVLAGANSAAGETVIEPIPNAGLHYRVELTQPIYMIAYVVTPVFSAPVGAWFKTRLTEGTIPNIMGREGTIQITRNGEERHYVMNIRLDSARFLSAGLRVAGPVDVNWRAAGTATPAPATTDAAVPATPETAPQASSDGDPRPIAAGNEADPTADTPPGEGADQ